MAALLPPAGNYFLRWGKHWRTSLFGCFASACSLHFTSDVVQMNVCMHTLHWKMTKKRNKKKGSRISNLSKHGGFFFWELKLENNQFSKRSRWKKNKRKGHNGIYLSINTIFSWRVDRKIREKNGFFYGAGEWHQHPWLARRIKRKNGCISKTLKK